MNICVPFDTIIYTTVHIYLILIKSNKSGQFIAMFFFFFFS